MHELSIAVNIIDIVEQSAHQSNALKVNRVVLEVGHLSGVEMEALKFAMSSVLKDTIADGALVEYHEIEGKALCEECGKESLISDFFSPCPHCNSNRINIIRGKEMRVVSIEVESD